MMYASLDLNDLKHFIVFATEVCLYLTSKSVISILFVSFRIWIYQTNEISV